MEESIQQEDQIFALNQAWLREQWTRVPGPGVGNVTAPVVWQGRLYIFSYAPGCDCLAYNVLELQEGETGGLSGELPVNRLFSVWGIWRLLEGESAGPLSAAVLGGVLHLFRRWEGTLLEARWTESGNADGTLGEPRWEALPGLQPTGPDTAGPVAVSTGRELWLFAFGQLARTSGKSAAGEPSLYGARRLPGKGWLDWEAPWGGGLTGRRLAGAALAGEPVLFRVDEAVGVEELRLDPARRVPLAPPPGFTGDVGATVFGPQQRPPFEPVLYLYAPTKDGRIWQKHRRADGDWRREWRVVPGARQAPGAVPVTPTLPTAVLHRGSLFLFYGVVEGFQLCLIHQPVDVDFDAASEGDKVVSRPDQLVQRRGVSVLLFTLYGAGTEGPATFSSTPFRRVNVHLGDSETILFRMRPLPVTEADGQVRQIALANFNATEEAQAQSVSFHFAVEADGETFLSPDPTVFNDPEEFEG